MEKDWSERLRRARRAAGMTQAALGERAAISTQTVRAYESARRHPSRAHLVAMLDALRTERGERNRILEAAGFAPDGLALRPPLGTVRFTSDEAAAEIERYRWPAFVTDEFARLLAANRAAQQLWQVDLAQEQQPLDPAQFNLLTVLANPRFADRLANWEEAMSILASVFKGHHRGPEDIDRPSPNFGAILDRFFAGDARYVSRFMEIWQAAPAPPAKMRWSYPIAWRHAGGILRFHAFASTANEADGLSFHDWIPLDAQTWTALEVI
jgi:transcriptional regulator with XRE-family HTH domain